MNATICLNMIVKNENKIILRLLESVVNFIDCYCICDTGSTDNTVELIKNFFTQKNIPGKIIYKEFINFATNRNYSLNECANMSDYILVLDADMIFDLKNFDKKKLHLFDNYWILQGSESFHSYNLRIIKNNQLYKYIGVTHEYLQNPDKSTNYYVTKNEIFIIDIGDGGSKQYKFERDIKLLTQGIIDEPNNSRYYFYLANSYFDMSKYNEAIELYKKRIEMGNWIEEVWYSYYRIGLSYKNMNDMKNAIDSWLDGYNLYQVRLEGLYEIIKYYRINSKNHLASIYYDIAKKILDKNLDTSKYLFLSNDIYSWKIYYEYTIISYYLKNLNINDECMKVFSKCNDNKIIENLISNLKYYPNMLVSKKKINFDNKFFAQIKNFNYEFYSSSSCMIKHNNYYIMNVRYVNYLINRLNGNYLYQNNKVITINKYMLLDNNFNIVENKLFFTEIEDNNKNQVIFGIEDIRILKDIKTNKIIFVGNSINKNNYIGVVHGTYDINNNILKSNELKQFFKKTNVEKNWVFVNFNDDIHLIYEWFPLTICKINNDELNILCKKKMPNIFKNVRGSTCGYNYKNEIWFIGHIVSYENIRYYYHIISVFDNNMNLLRFSAPFVFENEKIEYCLSIIINDNDIIINYSTWDNSTNICICEKKYIDNMLLYYD